MIINRKKWEQAFDADSEQDKIQRLVELTITEDEVWNVGAQKMLPDNKIGTSELSLEELREVYGILEGHLKHPFLTASDLATMKGEIDLRSSPEWIEEQRLKTQQRKEGQAATEQRVLREGLAALGGAGAKWADRKKEIEAWWQAVKAAEKKETWAEAYAANRMSARQINTAGRGGTFSIVNKKDRKDTGKRRDITLDRTANGIIERMKPENFCHPGTGASAKQDMGLHDLSASLLDSNKPVIDKQLKSYQDAVLVLVPVPTEQDSKIFHAICSLEEPDEDVLRGYRNRFTRVRLAEGSDMHTFYVDDTDGPTDPPQVRYGITGRVHLSERELVHADEAYVSARRTNALEHSNILGAGAKQPVNEIVMVYRQHDSELFPLFVKWDLASKRFNVLDRKTQLPTGDYIANDGKWNDEPTD